MQLAFVLNLELYLNYTPSKITLMKTKGWIACALLAVTFMASCAYKTCPTYAKHNAPVKENKVSRG
jgi:hypothetical protein